MKARVIVRRVSLNQKERDQIFKAVRHFEDSQNLFGNFAKSLLLYLGEDSRLNPYIHFIKYRVKDPKHLAEKLARKALEEKSSGRKIIVNENNIFSEITDLAGVRLIHLHTEQIKEINKFILLILQEQNCKIIEGPKAICWDREYEQLFNQFGIIPESRDSMYTSVHYIIEANQQTKIRAEIQVRTLMEEVWGEVSHRVDYPPGGPINRACQDQLKVLARLTSGSTRLVDSIFKSHESQT